ncbi:MAG: glycosyltransferase family 9 protein [Verrucomicrobia bacterium]|nr:glycosyltransferase family 9 protein [Verrucomicrobiota bacterium]
MNNILLFKLRYIGDVLLTTPAIRLLRNTFPNADITMVVNKGTEDILRHNPHLNRVLTVDRANGTWPLIRALRERRYDLSVDFFSGDRAAWLSLFSGAPERIGLVSNAGFRRFIYNRQVPWVPGHAVHLYLFPVEHFLGLKVTDTSLELHVGADDDQFAHRYGSGFVAIHMGARYPVNCWPRENWLELVNRLAAPVMFVGAQKEATDAKWILQQTKTPAVSLAGQTTILQLAALLKRAALFIGHDSGPMHIATAMGTKVIALFGPQSDVPSWRPWGEGHTVLPTSSSVEQVIASALHCP